MSDVSPTRNFIICHHKLYHHNSVPHVCVSLSVSRLHAISICAPEAAIHLSFTQIRLAEAGGVACLRGNRVTWTESLAMMHSKWAEAMLQAYSRHSLSRAALVTAGAPIFLLDTFTSLILYYTPGYPSSIPFPPPHSSLLRKTIQAVKQSRQISPQLKMFRGQQLLVPYKNYFSQSFKLTHCLLV